MVIHPCATEMRLIYLPFITLNWQDQLKWIYGSMEPCDSDIFTERALNIFPPVSVIAAPCQDGEGHVHEENGRKL